MDSTVPASRSQAVHRLREWIKQATQSAIETERVELGRAAGRLLAEPVTALADTPKYDQATMDGYAFPAADDYPLQVVDAVYPEDDPPEISPGEAVEIATGAPLPKRADAVLRKEDANVSNGRLSGPRLSPGTNRYPAGTTASSGEQLFAAGERLEPRHVALLRDAGVEAVTVRRRLSAAVLATGTEIHEGRQPDRDSEMLCNLLRRWGYRPSLEGTVPDGTTAVRKGIETAAAEHDVVVTTGGTSVGTADHVVNVLEDHDTLFQGVRLRPGRPTTAAVVDGTPVCALPGKPVAAHTAAVLVVRPALTGASRLPTISTTLATRVRLPEADFEYAVPVSLDGEAMPYGHAESPLSLYEERFAPGRVASSTRVLLADGLVVTRTAIDADDRVEVVPYEVIE